MVPDVINILHKFKYSEESPSCLIWKSGRHAGYLTDKGYWAVETEDKPFKCHNLIWAIHYGNIPSGMFIDHKDQIKTNNKIDNLRLVTNAVNCRNRSMRKDNKSGINGIRRCMTKQGTFKWVAYWIDERGKLITKTFTENKFGEEAFHLAKQAREEAIEILNEKGLCYSPIHGRTGK